jgi:hypothetical protein
MDNANTLCRFAWDYPNVNLSRNELRSCCRAGPNIVSDADVDELGTRLFSELKPLVKMKRELLQGIKTSACKTCWSIEANGSKSPRKGKDDFIEFMVKTNWFNTTDHKIISDKLSNLTDDETDALSKFLDKPRMLEIALSNVCDLKCMYCNHHYSSQWTAESLKYKDIPIERFASEFPVPSTKYKDIFWEYFLRDGYKTIEYINFIGGEPLIIDEFYEHLETVINKYETYKPLSAPLQKVCIGVVTNMNCQEKYFQKFLDVIPRILENPHLRVEIGVSLESIKERTEFIRTGTKWDRLNSNVERLIAKISSLTDDQRSRISFGFQIALNSLCISDLPAFCEYIVNLRRSTPCHIRLHHNQIAYPQWLSPSILTPDYGVYIDRAIRVLLDSGIDESHIFQGERWSSYCRYLLPVKQGIINENKNTVIQKSFITNVDKLSARRNLNFAETFPEMMDFYNSIKGING